MKKETGYKITVFVLLLIIVLQAFFMVIARPKIAPRMPPEIKGRIAIVLDDWGYNLNNLSALKEIKYPITCSVLPNLNYSRTVAKEAHDSGFEVILHLPMEPRERYRLEKNTIMTSLDEQAIVNIIAGDLANLVYARGVSNHMGSRVTEDARTMEIIFKELKKRRLFFLDSFVTPGSICSDIAGKVGLGFARRNVFLDNKQQAEYIRGQVYNLKMEARKYGQAIGIGHDRKITLEVLREIMPLLEQEGYKFVLISELVK